MRAVPAGRNTSGEGPASIRGIEPASRRRAATTFADSIPAIATGAAFFMIVLDTSIVNLALPRIGTELDAGLTTLQWLVDGYLLVFASLLLGAGALGDRFGVKGTIMCGLLVFTLASALCGMAANIAALQASRIVQGVGAALLLPNSLAALNHTFSDPLRRTKAVSTWASAGALGVALGPVLGPSRADTRVAKHLHRQRPGRPLGAVADAAANPESAAAAVPVA